MTPIRIDPGSASRSVYVRILKDNGQANTALAYNSANLAASYVRDNAAAGSIPLMSLASGSAAYASGGFVHVAQGVYRLDVPNAALAAGAKFVVLLVAEATDIRADAVVIDLTARLAPSAAGQTLNVDSSGRVDVGGIMGRFLDFNPAQTTLGFGAYVGTSTYAGGDTPGTTTLLTRITAAITTAAQQTQDVTNVLAAIQAVPGLTWVYNGGRTLTGFGSLVADLVAGVWGAAVRKVTGGALDVAPPTATEIAGAVDAGPTGTNAAQAAAQATAANAKAAAVAASMVTVGGNVSTLIDRLTDQRAAKLDHLNADVSDAVEAADAATQAAMDAEASADAAAAGVGSFPTLQGITDAVLAASLSEESLVAEIVNRLERAGGPIAEIQASTGGDLSPLWLKLLKLIESR